MTAFPSQLTALTRINFLFVVRLLVALFFIVVSVDKVMSPYQNFLYVVQSYQLFPEMIEEVVARIFPWIQLFLGVFLLLGLYLKWILRAFLLMISAFLLLIGQALARQLPLSDCGCFGGLFAMDPQNTFFLDIALWLLTVIMLRSLPATSTLSLDKYFAKNEK